ncbi:MlaC/ttg2D family ABC transporter substrate-binding protein [Paracoccus suum]|uniref:MlaC/ttg2D family ABC transporter substrate-binding protein n=1 Tax=Paracoccus suum TaxID=2259340 RepID=UPI001F546F2E|nr:ABC transporter substrate-binding protein [Paracoccus suum]
MTHIATETRRGFLGLMAGAGVLAVARPALALSTDGARTLIQHAVADVYSVINSGLPAPQMYARFTDIFVRYADVPVIARSCLGPAARQAQPAALTNYTNAFTGYIGRKYGKRFHDFVGGRIDVGQAAPVKSFVAVQSTAYLNGQEPIAVEWHVSDKSGQVRFFNLIVEGVNMISTERAEIAALLGRHKGDINALASDLARAS